MIISNAQVYTVDDRFSTASAFAVHDGKFIAVGQDREILNSYTSDKIIDAQGKTVVPGLIDAHCHFYNLGILEQQARLEGTGSYEEVLQRVEEFYEENPGAFIIGRGWDQNDWEVKEFPTKKELDERFPDIPVILKRIDGHAYLVNQKALDLAGINRNTWVPGGEVIKKWGVPTGVLVDGPMKLIDSIIPKPGREQIAGMLLTAQDICLSYGLTTVNDAGLDRQVIEIIDSLQQAGDLKIKVYAMVSNSPANVEYFLGKGVIKTPRLNVRSVKVYGDGALGSRGAALRSPYSDQPGHFGAMRTPIADMEALAQKLAGTEYQMNTHAIGDSANIAVLRIYKKVLEGQEDRRWKIEHAQIVSAGDFSYFESGIIPSVQPTHATSDMYWAEDRLGPERIQGAYAFKSLLDRAGVLPLGTDFPVEEVSPFNTFYAAVARQDLQGYPEGGYRLEEALTREEALKGMTIWPAYSNFEEHEKGSIEVGKMADFVLLSGNIMTVPIKEIPTLQAELVYINGALME